MNQFLCCNKLLARNGDDPRKLLIVSRNAPKYPRVLLRSFLFDQFSLLLFLFKTGRKSLLEETRENENNNKMKTEDNTIFRRKFCCFFLSFTSLHATGSPTLESYFYPSFLGAAHIQLTRDESGLSRTLCHIKSGQGVGIRVSSFPYWMT